MATSKPIADAKDDVVVRSTSYTAHDASLAPIEEENLHYTRQRPADKEQTQNETGAAQAERQAVADTLETGTRAVVAVNNDGPPAIVITSPEGKLEGVPGGIEATEASSAGETEAVGPTYNKTCDTAIKLDPGQILSVCSKKAANEFQDIASRSQLAQTVAESLQAVYTRAEGVDPVERAREMRFGLRLIVTTFVDMIEAGVRERNVFQLEVVNVVDPLSTRVQNVQFLAANTIRDILEAVDWGLSVVGADGEWLPNDQQPSNITMRQILAGIRIVNEQINAVLLANETDDLEFDEDIGEDDAIEADEDEMEDEDGINEVLAEESGSLPAPRLRPATVFQGVMAQAGSTTGPASRPRSAKVSWTAEEDAILVQVARDMRGATQQDIMNEHNARMARNRARARATVHLPRGFNAIRSRLRDLRKTYPDI